MTALLLSMTLALVGAIDDTPTGDADFDYYFGEFLSYDMQPEAPMAKLITNRLATALFDTTSDQTFKTRIQLLLRARNENPEKLARFSNLDGLLAGEFEARMKAAKQKRMLYTEIGAIAGAVVAIPIGLVVGQKFTSMGAKFLLIAIPVGALAGGGAGFLLGNLLAMPDIKYEPGILSKDLKLMNSDLDDIK